MKIQITVFSSDDKIIEQKEFIHTPSQGITETNGITISAMILLAIRYLCGMGPY